MLKVEQPGGEGPELENIQIKAPARLVSHTGTKGSPWHSLPPFFLELLGVWPRFWGQTMADCWTSLSPHCSSCFPAWVRGGGQLSETPFLNRRLAAPTLLEL